jgi:hypothetical protein
MYVSKNKVEDLIESLPPTFWSRLSAKVGFALPPVQLEASLKERPETRSAIREQIEKTLRKQGRLGSVDEPPPFVEGHARYVVGELTMRWAVHEDIRPQIVWFVGSTDRTLIALGGRARHLTQLYPEELKDKSPADAELRHVEKQVVADLARKVEPQARAKFGSYSSGTWVDDVRTVHDYWLSELVDRVNFLAVVEGYCHTGERERNEPRTAVLLGSPVFLFRTG